MKEKHISNTSILFKLIYIYESVFSAVEKSKIIWEHNHLHLVQPLDNGCIYADELNVPIKSNKEKRLNEQNPKVFETSATNDSLFSCFSLLA